MILSDSEILTAINMGSIVITPFDLKNLGSNSYDVHLSKHYATYGCAELIHLDAKKDNPVVHQTMTERGFTLVPGTLYLMSTEEYTETKGFVPFLEGKSSTGRLGIAIHATAGKGDDGFKGHWTLEVSVVHPVHVYPGMPIGQIIYFKMFGETKVPYDQKMSAKYNNKDPLPKGSMMFKNFPEQERKTSKDD